MKKSACQVCQTKESKITFVEEYNVYWSIFEHMLCKLKGQGVPNRVIFCISSIVSKLLERHVTCRDCLIDFLERKAVLSSNQWGFIKGRSTTGVLWSSSLTVGIDHLSRGMMFVLFSWISVKPSTKFPTNHC